LLASAQGATDNFFPYFLSRRFIFFFAEKRAKRYKKRINNKMGKNSSRNPETLMDSLVAFRLPGMTAWGHVRIRRNRDQRNI
jgi:hypothetical protein